MRLLRTTFLLALMCLCRQVCALGSGDQAIPESHPDTASVRKLYELAQASVTTDTSKALGLAELAVRNAMAAGNRDVISEALAAKGAVLNETGRYSESLAMYDSAASVAIKGGALKKASRHLYAAGLVCYMRSRYAEALHYFLKDLKVTEKVRDSVKMATLLNDIGVVYENLTDYSNSLKYHGRSLNLRKQLKDTAGIAMSCNNLGMVSYYQGHYARSLQYHEESLRIRQSLRDTQGIVYSIFNISNIFYSVALMPPDSAFSIFRFSTSLSSRDISRVLLDSAMSLRQFSLSGARSLNDRFAEAWCLKGIGEIFVTKKDWGKALPYLEQAADVAAALSMQKELSEIYLRLHEVYLGKGKEKEALEYYKRYTAAKDSVFGLQTSRRIGELQTQLEVEKKEQEIEVLSLRSEVLNREVETQKLLRNIAITGIVVLLTLAIIIFRQRNRISREKRRSEELLLNILPKDTAEELKASGQAKVRKHQHVTVMFTDFKNFTGLSEQRTPEDLVAEIDYCFREFDIIISKYRIEKIKTIGDSYMCASGLPASSPTHAIDMVRAALEIRDFMKRYRSEQLAMGRETFEIRIGLHSGEVVSGIVGIKKFAYDIWGDTVNIASRMESSSEPGKVNISGSTFDLVNEYFNCQYRGKIEAKNRGVIDMYYVSGEK